VTLRIGEKAIEELNGLKAGEMCEVVFGNEQYDNYKLKRLEDSKEVYWFKSNQVSLLIDILIWLLLVFVG
jgi:hypothetical protein